MKSSYIFYKYNCKIYYIIPEFMFGGDGVFGDCLSLITDLSLVYILDFMCEVRGMVSLEIVYLYLLIYLWCIF